MENKNHLAFPVHDSNGECYPDAKGFTKLEYTSILIMQGLVSNNFSPTGFKNTTAESLSKIAIDCAKELLEQLNKQENGIHD